VGLLDEERFAEGYCEENDYSLRARAAGFALAVAQDTYLFHAKSRSYGAKGRAELAGANYEKLLQKHGRERVAAEVAELETSAALAAVRQAVARGSASPQACVAAMCGSEGGRYREREGAPGERAPLSVAFVLPGLAHGGSGGSHSLHQETRALRELGVPARIMLPRWDRERAAAVYEDFAEVFETFADAEDLAERTADAHVISATHHKSVALLAAIRERRSDFLPAYYVQDYEPFFTAPYIAEEAVASYTALPGMLLFGEVFHARGRSEQPGALRVAAMLRPRTARRQPLATIAVLQELLARHPREVQVSTFGCYTDELRELLGAGGSRVEAIVERHRGLLSRRQVAELLRESDVFVDMSVYQAFGRTALEAMACGATAVVPSVGGVWEFVAQGGNALAVDTLSAEGALGALGSLVGDRELLSRLKAGAVASAARCSATRAALSEYVLFERAHSARFGRSVGGRELLAAVSAGEQQPE
jgi:hypothetical protein